MKKLLLVLMFFFSTYACAEVNTYKLTDEQAAQLQLQAAQMRKANEGGVSGVLPTVSPSTLDAAKQWADIGRGVAVGIGAGARELGVAVNEFAVTPAGKLTTAIIVWKIMGKDVIRIGLCLFLWIFAIPGIWIIRNRATIDRIEYETYKGLLGWNYRRIKTKVRSDGDGTMWGTIISILGTAVLMIISITVLVG